MATFKSVSIKAIQFAETNPKLHDLGALAASEERYGFVEPPIINETSGRLVAGEGRIRALLALQAEGKPPPAGVTVKAGEWFVTAGYHPFKSDAEAQAYLFDSNNLGLLGGDFTAWDMERLWDPEAYKATLKALGEQQALPISVDGDSLDALLMPPTNPLEEWKGMPEIGSVDILGAAKSIIVHFKTPDDIKQFSELVGQTVTENTKSIWYPKQNFDELGKGLEFHDES